MTDDTHSGKIERRDAPSPPRSTPAGSTEEVLARGRAARTPFVLLGGMALAIWAVVAVVAVAVLLLWWLA
jgi:disulfide bond formation protein DsbB